MLEMLLNVKVSINRIFRTDLTVLLSPVLFRFYIHDLGESFVNKQCTDIYKFADDGTAKVSGVTLQYSLSTMQSVLDEIHKWTKKWRMVINYHKNKTELICFNSPEGKPPQSFKLGEDEIHTALLHPAKF